MNLKFAFTSVFALALASVQAAFPPPYQRNTFTTNDPGYGIAATNYSDVTKVKWSTMTPNGLLVSSNGGLTFEGGYLTANLPTPTANQSMIAWTSDVITPQGIGGYVRWDGTKWKNWHHIQATTDYTNYMLYCWSAFLNSKSAITYSYTERDLGDSLIGDFTKFSGGGGSFGGTRSAYGSFFAAITGTATNGMYGYYGVSVVTLPLATNYLASGGAFALSALCDGTDIYWVSFGLSRSYDETKPSYSADFIYDMFNITGHNQTGDATNHWLCRISTNSTYYYYDTGLTPSVSTTTPDRLLPLMFPGWVGFYTNGVLCVSTTTNIPNASASALLLNLNKGMIRKWSGTTSRTLYSSVPYSHVRHMNPVITIP